MPCGWGVKAGMVRVWVAGKTVWSLCHTRAIFEHLRDQIGHYKALYKFTFCRCCCVHLSRLAVVNIFLDIEWLHFSTCLSVSCLRVCHDSLLEMSHCVCVSRWTTTMHLITQCCKVCCGNASNAKLCRNRSRLTGRRRKAMNQMWAWFLLREFRLPPSMFCCVVCSVHCMSTAVMGSDALWLFRWPQAWQKLMAANCHACLLEDMNVNFEHTTFWCILFTLLILVSVNLIDINMCKVLILCEMCYFCVLRLLHGTVATKQMYGRKFLNRVLWHSHAKLCTKKYKICLYL